MIALAVKTSSRIPRACSMLSGDVSLRFDDGMHGLYAVISFFLQAAGGGIHKLSLAIPAEITQQTQVNSINHRKVSPLKRFIAWFRRNKQCNRRIVITSKNGENLQEPLVIELSERDYLRFSMQLNEIGCGAKFYLRTPAKKMTAASDKGSDFDSFTACGSPEILYEIARKFGLAA